MPERVTTTDPYTRCNQVLFLNVVIMADMSKVVEYTDRMWSMNIGECD
jgi:hypothetical protein